MNNCEHITHQDDCCVCWFKQSMNTDYDNDIPLFINKLEALLSGIPWRDYCLNKALNAAKANIERGINQYEEL